MQGDNVGSSDISGNRIPRWLVENDPSWVKSIDSSLGVLRWTKKGTGVQAVCSPTSMFCEVVGSQNDAASSLHVSGAAGALSDPRTSAARIERQKAALAGDIAKYLSSRYVNPGINDPARFDTKRFRKF